MAFGVDLRDPYRPQFPVLNGVNIYDPSRYTLAMWQAPADDPTSQRNIQGALNVARPYSGKTTTGLFQVGAKLQDASKTRVVSDQYYGATGAPVLTAASVAGGPTDPGYYFGAYPVGRLTDYNKLVNALASNPSAIALNVDSTHQRDAPNSYQVSERIYAAYAMHARPGDEPPPGRPRRNDAVFLYGQSRHVERRRPLRVDAAGPRKLELHECPAEHSVSLRLRSEHEPPRGVRDGHRASELWRFAPVLPRTGPPSFGEHGQPGSQADAGEQHRSAVRRFLDPVGIIQVGYFSKWLTDPIYRLQTTVTGGTYAGFSQTQPTNGADASVHGIEMSWQQHLSFLPGALSGLGASANYSYTTSKASVPGRADDPALLRQTPNNWNLDATYDRGGFSARLGVTHNDANIYSYNYQPSAAGGLSGPNGDLYLYAHTQVDAQASYTLHRQIQLVLALLNLNNEVFGFYQGSPQYPVQREFYNRTVSVGVRLTR